MKPLSIRAEELQQGLQLAVSVILAYLASSLLGMPEHFWAVMSTLNVLRLVAEVGAALRGVADAITQGQAADLGPLAQRVNGFDGEGETAALLAAPLRLLHEDLGLIAKRMAATNRPPAPPAQ